MTDTAEMPRRRSRLARAWKWLLIAGAALLLLLVLLVIEEHMRGAMLLKQWQQQMVARGERFTYDEILPQPPDPNDNAAAHLAPLFGGQVVPRDLPATWRYVAPGRCVVAPMQGEWFADSSSRVHFTTNPFTANASATTARRQRGRQPGRTNSAAFRRITPAQVAADVQTASNALAAIRVGLRKRGLDFGVDYRSGFNVPLGHLSSYRQTAFWLRAGSLGALMETNHQASLEYLQDLAAFVRLQTNGVFLIAYLVRASTLQIAAGATWEALQVPGWTEPQLAALQHSWEPMQSGPWLARAGEVERVMGGDEIERIAEQGPDRLAPWTALASPATAPASAAPSLQEVLEDLSEFPRHMRQFFVRGVYFPLWRFAWKDQDKLNLYRNWQPFIDTARAQGTNPNWVLHRSRVATKQTNEANEVRPDPRYLVSRLMSAVGADSLKRMAEIETIRAMTVTAIALERARRSDGRYPASLDELVPKYLPAVLADPMDGKPLRYRPPGATNSHFALYSVGPDGQDDGGDPTSRTNDRAGLFVGRDLVWPIAASREEVIRAEQATR